MNDVTRILSAIDQGDPRAAEQLLPLVYDELRRLAAARLAQENPGQTLQATALVHEAYLRLVGNSEAGPHQASPGQASPGRKSGKTEQQWDSRGHFFAAAAEAMRRILVESARRKLRLKHGGEYERVDVELADLPTRLASDDLLALDEALDNLTRQDPLKSKLVTLRYFGGLTIEQAAEALGISRVTAHRYWTYARAFLHQQIRGSNDGE